MDLSTQPTRSIWIRTLLVAGAIACSDPEPLKVTFTQSRPIGRWAQAHSEAGRAGRASSDASPADGDAGAGSEGHTGGTGAKNTTDGGADGGGRGNPAEPRRVLSFRVTTHEQHPEDPRLITACRGLTAGPDKDYCENAHGPKNMGAIWIEGADGGFVKTLKVWGGEAGLGRSRFRHLVGYTNAVGSADAKVPRNEVDVVASATLEKHDTHAVEWNLRNREGKQVELGEHALMVEIADYNTDDFCEPKKCPLPCDRECDVQNATCSVSFDTTRLGAVDAPDTEYCTDMKLQLNLAAGASE